MKQDIDECTHEIGKITEQISKDYSLVDEEILYKIYLIKCYCQMKSDFVLANQAAKMAIDIQKS